MSIFEHVRNNEALQLSLLIGVVVGLMAAGFAFLSFASGGDAYYVYQDMVGIFEQCITDDTFTRAECVIIVGGGK